MAVLEKIRVKFGLAATIIIAIGLLLFIVDPNELSSAFQSMSSKNYVGKIGGKKISYMDFQDDVQRMNTVNELMFGSVQGAQQQEQARNTAWQNLIYRHLFNKKAKSAGINVGEEEVVDLTTGTNLSPVVSQIPVFYDESGNFSKERVSNFIQQMNSDQTGQLRTFWNFLQETVMNTQYFDKYASLFNTANGLNKVELDRMIQENNNTTDVRFVMVPLSYMPDTSIVVSDKEIADYYAAHKKNYKQVDSRDMEYVVYEIVPSEKDINAAKEEISKLSEEFSQATNMKSFLIKNSDRPYSEYWYKKTELSSAVAPVVEDFVWGDSREAMSGMLTSGNNFYYVRVLGTRTMPESAYVKHILLQGDDADSRATELMDMLRKPNSDFSTLAEQYSDDKNSAAPGKGGTIGWMTQNYTIPGMETAVLTATINEPFIIKTQYGTHIVLVEQQSEPVEMKQVAILQKEAVPSTETFNDFYNKANTFATIANGNYENYRKAIDSLGVYSHPINHMQESNDRLGSIDNAREVTRWVFDNKPGKVSRVMTIDNNYFVVATVKAIHKEGTTPLSEVSSTIRQTLFMEKSAEKKRAEVAEKIAGIDNLDVVAEKLGLSVSNQSGVAFSSMNSQGLDPKFIGALSVSPEGKVCGPVAGSIGIYVYEVTGRDTGAFFTEDDALKRDMEQQRTLSQFIVPVMMESADVQDNRAKFY